VVGAYLVGDQSAPDAVVVAADAPGWRAPGVRRFARLLHSESNALVVVPDLARGDTWYGDPDPVKRAGDKNFEEWQRGHPAERLAADAAAVGVALRERGATRVAVVGVGTGAGAVAALLGKKASGEEKKSEDEETKTRETMDAGAVACAVGLDAASASRAADSGVPTLFVWGGGASAAQQMEKTNAAAEGNAGESAPRRWRCTSYPDADEHFAFFSRLSRDGEEASGGENPTRHEIEATKSIAEWIFP
jgi:hypothetical protein